MLILFDHGTPRGIASWLPGHTVKEARTQGWDRLTNGELLKAAEEAHFDLLLTTDKNIRHQQNLARRRIAIVVLGKGRWRLVRPSIAAVDRGSECGRARKLHRSCYTGLIGGKHLCTRLSLL
jgi:hypothetical protein